MQLLSFAISFLLCIYACKAQDYVLVNQYSGTQFFPSFNFFTGPDPTNGYVNYVPQSEAVAEGLVYVEEDFVYIGADQTNIASGLGRSSVRLESKLAWTEGLFIMDLLHMPTGCATWPSWWVYGADWPNNGEIDIIEGVNTMTADLTSLHTSEGCIMEASGASQFSGTWEVAGTKNATNCWVDDPSQPSNEGCGINGLSNSYGAPFNSNDGGVYAMEWTSSYIKTYYFPRSTIPADITANSPNVSSWGLPYAQFTLGGDCPTSHFNSMTMILDLTFCGDWAGSEFASECPNLGTCENYVQMNPDMFSEAYWAIRYIQVYQDSSSNSSFVVDSTIYVSAASSAPSVINTLFIVALLLVLACI